MALEFLGPIFGNFDPILIVYGAIFLIFFAMINFVLSKTFKDQYGNPSKVAPIISLCIAILILYYGGDFISNLFRNLSIDQNLLYWIAGAVIIIGLFSVSKKIGFWGPLIGLIGVGLILSGVFELVYRTGFVIILGAILTALGLFKILKKKSSEENSKRIGFGSLLVIIGFALILAAMFGIVEGNSLTFIIGAVIIFLGIILAKRRNRKMKLKDLGYWEKKDFLRNEERKKQIEKERFYNAGRKIGRGFGRLYYGDPRKQAENLARQQEETRRREAEMQERQQKEKSKSMKESMNEKLAKGREYALRKVQQLLASGQEINKKIGLMAGYTKSQIKEMNRQLEIRKRAGNINNIREDRDLKARLWAQEQEKKRQEESIREKELIEKRIKRIEKIYGQKNMEWKKYAMAAAKGDEYSRDKANQLQQEMQYLVDQINKLKRY